MAITREDSIRPRFRPQTAAGPLLRAHWLAASAMVWICATAQAQTLTQNLSGTLNTGAYSAATILSNCNGAVSAPATCVSVTLNSNAKVTLSAGNQIVLGPGFTAVGNSTSSLITAISATQSTGPAITGMSPLSGATGTVVTIVGTNFGATQGTSTVTFGGVAATASSWSASSIVIAFPSGLSGTINPVVTVGGLTSVGPPFTVTQPSPAISSLSPTSGAAGTAVTITGANFGGTQGTSTVTFGGVAATVSSWSATSIVAAVPTGLSGAVSVVVTVGGIASRG